jgi:hypothetical protein
MSFLDLSNVEESKGGYTPPVDGEYHIQVEDCEVSVKVCGICMAKVKNGTYNDKPQTKLSYFKKVDDTQSASESVFS